ncbi:MAG: hypothetical protein HY347_07350 [candidate division NC10 bacterium]|nr:hypothetical protein [candidate division NC10 bacterium]
MAIKRLRDLRRKVRDDPYLSRVFGIPPLQLGGRSEGSRSIDPMLSLRIALAIDQAGYTPTRVLRILGRLTDGPAPYRWLKRRLKWGRAILFELDHELEQTFSPEQRKKHRRWIETVVIPNIKNLLREAAPSRNPSPRR